VTLLALFLISVSLAGPAFSAGRTWLLFAAALAASFAATMAMVVLLGYAMGAGRQSLSLLSQVALHTAFALLLLSAGAAGMLWTRIVREGVKIPAHLPLAAGLACVVGTITFLQLQRSDYLRQLNMLAAAGIDAVAHDLDLEIEIRLRATERMAHRLAADPSMPPPLWMRDARRHLEDLPEIAAFSWSQAGGQDYRLPLPSEAGRALPSFQAALPVALGMAPVMTPVFEHGKAWILVAFEWPARPAGRDRLVAAIDAEDLLAAAAGDSIAPSLGVTATLSDRPVFSRGPPPASANAVVVTRIVRPGDLDLRLVAWPKSAEMSSPEAQTETFMVATGLLASVLVPLFLAMMRRAQLLNLELAERGDALAGSNRDLESFAYSVAHDLRAPLRHIGSYARLLEKALRGRIGEEERRLLEVVIASSVRQSALVDDLLRYARIGNQDMAPAGIELEKLVPGLVASLREEADPGRRFQVDVDTPHVAIADATLLRVALENLVRNAFKFAAGSANPSLSVRSEALADGRVALSVRDNGVGFDMQFAGKLFGVFQRLHAASEFPGTGIGLAIVRRAVEKMGGTIAAEASAGKGAIFTIWLEGGKLA
jgi:signal transduction histidine kinase